MSEEPLSPLRRGRTTGLMIPGGAEGPPGWEVCRGERCTVHAGYFQARAEDGTVRLQVVGRVIEWPGLPADVLLYDPPAALRAHPHGSCLQLLTPGDHWFKFHWEKPPWDFESSRAYVQQLLAEC